MLSGALQVQLHGKGSFANAHVQLEDSSLTLDLLGSDVHSPRSSSSTVGIRVSDPKTARQGHPHAFRVDLAVPDSNGVSKYVLSASSAPERAKFMKALKAASKRGPPRERVRAASGPSTLTVAVKPADRTPPGSPGSAAVAPSPRRIGAARSPASNSGRRHEGWLMRRRGPRSSWDRRWLRLDGAGLATFDRQGGSRQDFLALRDLLEARHSQAPGSVQSDQELEVLSRERTWRLRASSSTEMEAWIHALRSAIHASSSGTDKATADGLVEPEPEPEPEPQQRPPPQSPLRLSGSNALVRQSSMLGTPRLCGSPAIAASNKMFLSSPGAVGRSLEELWGSNGHQRLLLLSSSDSESTVEGGGYHRKKIPRAESAGAAAGGGASRGGVGSGPSTFPDRATVIDGRVEGAERAGVRGGGAPMLLKRTKSERLVPKESGDRGVLRRSLQVKETVLFVRCYIKNDHFAKTGSGQT